MVEELPFEIDVYRKGFRSRASYYPMSPIRIESGPDGLPYNAVFSLEHSYNELFHLTTQSKAWPKLDTLISFGQSISYNNRSFTLYSQPELEDVFKSEIKDFEEAKKKAPPPSEVIEKSVKETEETNI